MRPGRGPRATIIIGPERDAFPLPACCGAKSDLVGDPRLVREESPSVPRDDGLDRYAVARKHLEEPHRVRRAGGAGDGEDDGEGHSGIYDTRYEIRDTRDEIRETRYEIRDTRHPWEGGQRWRGISRLPLPYLVSCISYLVRPTRPPAQRRTRSRSSRRSS